jgi:WD40 repeat protein
MLASGSFDGSVRLWDVAEGNLLATVHAHSGTAWGVALSADGRLLATSGVDGLVRLWDTSGPQLLATLEGHTGPVYGLALSADGQLLASGSFDGTVRLWDPRSGMSLNTLRSDRRYERVDITGLSGVTAAQRAALLALGALERDRITDETRKTGGRAWLD